MAVTVNSTKTVNANGETVTLNPGANFVGKVVSMKFVTIQIMSDVWADYPSVTVANDDGSTFSFTIMSEDPFSVVVDVTPELLAKVEERKEDFETARAGIKGAEYNVRRSIPRLCKGCKAKVVAGRKVKIGIEVDVFWVGTVNNKFSGQREERAGIKVNGETVWVSAKNLQVIPTEAQKVEQDAAQVELDAAKKNYEKVAERWNAALVAA